MRNALLSGGLASAGMLVGGPIGGFVGGFAGGMIGARLDGRGWGSAALDGLVSGGLALIGGGLLYKGAKSFGLFLSETATSNYGAVTLAWKTAPATQSTLRTLFEVGEEFAGSTWKQLGPHPIWRLWKVAFSSGIGGFVYAPVSDWAGEYLHLSSGGAKESNIPAPAPTVRYPPDRMPTYRIGDKGDPYYERYFKKYASMPDVPKGMGSLEMPNQHIDGFSDPLEKGGLGLSAYRFLDVVEQYHAEDLPNFLVGVFNSFGVEPKSGEPPLSDPPQEVPVLSFNNVPARSFKPEYAQYNTDMQESLEAMLKHEKAIRAEIKESEKALEVALAQFKNVISTIKDSARALPVIADKVGDAAKDAKAIPMDENRHIMEYVKRASETVTKNVENLTAEMRKLAGNIDKNVPGLVSTIDNSPMSRQDLIDTQVKKELLQAAANKPNPNGNNTIIGPAGSADPLQAERDAQARRDAERLNAEKALNAEKTALEAREKADQAALKQQQEQFKAEMDARTKEAALAAKGREDQIAAQGKQQAEQLEKARSASEARIQQAQEENKRAQEENSKRAQAAQNEAARQVPRESQGREGQAGIPDLSSMLGGSGRDGLGRNGMGGSPSIGDQSLDRNGLSQQRDPRGDQVYRGPNAPVVPAQSVPSPPAQAPVNPNNPANPANPAPAAPNQPVKPPDSHTPPPVTPKTPAPDGSVDYTYPDGRTQKISQSVAKALDVAFGNAAGTDAMQAYGNSAAQADYKKIGARVDPNKLMTGDVSVWQDKGAKTTTALLVVFGPDRGNTLEAVVNGHLTPFTGDMQDGRFGDFTGFFHPDGIEVGAANGLSDQLLPVPADTGAATV